MSVSSVNVVGTPVAEPVVRRRALALPAALFLVLLLVPAELMLGTLRLSPYRVLLLVLLPALLWGWLVGRTGAPRLADFALLGFCLWAGLSFAANHEGAVAVQATGILAVETFGAWLLGRRYLRDAAAFIAMVRLLAGLILLMAPLVLVETLTGRNASLALLDTVFRVPPDVWKPLRWGLDRVQGPLHHPILFGVFCGVVFGLTWALRTGPGRLLTAGGVGATAALSLSSGPLAALAAQAGLVAWSWLSRGLPGRWALLAATGLGLWLSVEAVAARSAAAIFIDLFAFDPATAWNRLAIWDHGWLNIARNPLLGLGFGDWVRASWMTPSMDMFWLVPAVRHGLPAAMLFWGAVLAAVLPVMSRSGLSPASERCRAGWLIALAGLFVAGWTTHYWEATYVLLMFLLGGGAWLTEADRS